MYCTNCGVKLPDDARFCYSCGQKVAELPGQSAPEKPAAAASPAASAAAAVKKFVPDTAALKPSGSFTGMDMMALAAAVLSVIFAICSIKIYMTWLILVAAVLLAGVCFMRLHCESLPMAVPITVFMIAIVFSSIRLFRYLRYYKFLAATQTVLPLVFSICAAVFYWLMVFKVGNKKKITTACLVMIAGYAIICITTSLSGDPASFRTVASRLASILFMIAYILRMVETSEVLAPALPEGYSAETFAGGNDYVHYPHPYQELGGYLKFTVIGGTIVAVLAIVGMIAGMIPVFKMLSYVSKYANMTFLYIIVILLMIVSIVVYALLIRLLMMIKNKNQKFLWSYHKLAIAEVVVVFVLQWITNGFGTAVVHLILFFLLFFVFTLYFVKSVRVRTYMQSEEYLRIDPLTRNVPSPLPADIAPYTGE